MSEQCGWTQDGEESCGYETDCNEYFVVLEGTPTENKMAFCCYCGKPLVEFAFPSGPDNDDDTEYLE